jgi:hypothetical protein
MKTLRTITLFETECRVLLIIARQNGTGRLLLAVKPRRLEVAFAQCQPFAVPVRVAVNDNHDGRHTGKYFEEFVQLLPGGGAKGLGVRVVEAANGRPLGVAGAQRITLTQPVTLLRCFREVTIKASAKRPMDVMTTLQRVEGR